MFSRRSVMLLTLSSCLGPTLVDTEVEPHEPQPSVSDGSRWKLNTSPMAPCGDRFGAARQQRVVRRPRALPAPNGPSASCWQVPACRPPSVLHPGVSTARRFSHLGGGRVDEDAHRLDHGAKLLNVRAVERVGVEHARVARPAKLDEPVSHVHRRVEVGRAVHGQHRAQLLLRAPCAHTRASTPHQRCAAVAPPACPAPPRPPHLAQGGSRRPAPARSPPTSRRTPQRLAPRRAAHPHRLRRASLQLAPHTAHAPPSPPPPAAAPRTSESGSSLPMRSTSPMMTLAPGGTLMPNSSASLDTDWPTMLALRRPSMITLARTCTHARTRHPQPASQACAVAQSESDARRRSTRRRWKRKGERRASEGLLTLTFSSSLRK